MGTTADCGVEGCSMGLMCSSGEMRDRVVDKDVGGGGRGFPTDSLSPNEEQIGPLGRVESAGRVYRQRGCVQWVRPLRGYIRQVPRHRLTG